MTASGSAANAQPDVFRGWEGKVVPLEQFAKFPTLSQPQLSPDGRTIAVKVGADNIQALALVSIGDPQAKARIIARDADFSDPKLGDREIYAWRWIDDDNLIINLRSRDNQFGQWFDVTRVAAYNLKSGKISPLGWDNAAASAGNILWMSPPGDPRPRVVIGRQSNRDGTERWFNQEVIEVDVATGRTTLVQGTNPLVTNWIADNDGVVRMGSSRDRRTGKVRVLYRADARSNFATISNEATNLYDDVALPSIILAGSNKAYSLSNHEGYRALYEYDLEAMKVGAKIFGVPGYDVSSASLTPDRTALQGYHWTDTRGRTQYVEPRMREIQQLLDESFGKGNVLITSTDLKREKILFTVAELGQVPAYHLFDTVTGNIGRVAWVNDALQNARLNPVSTVRYKGSDGKEIEAILTLPRHKKGEKNLAAVVMPHGGPWARDDADWDPTNWAQAMAENGYVVIQPNYRGSTGYGAEFGRAADGNWGERMQDDLNDAVAWMASQGIADAKRVCMMGWSYGGYAASRAAQRDGDRYRCAISGAGVHDLPAMVRYDRSYLGPYMARTALGAAGADLRTISPAHHAADFSIPILIVHGAKDQRVPVAQSRGLVSRLKSAGKVEGRDFRYIEQPLNTHHLLREKDRLEYLTETLEWLKKHNPA